MRLPIEVCEVIIDQFSGDYHLYPSLLDGRLSLVCTEFLPRSRYHIWSNVHIRSRKQMLSSRDFFEGHPWLCPLVHTVTISQTARGKARHTNVIPVHLLTRFPNLDTWKINDYPDLGISFHRPALQCYQIYGSCIHHLHLDVGFNRISDFTGLVSAFTSLHTLTCSHIHFRQKEESDSSQVTLRSNTFSRHLPISTLQLDNWTDIRATEYLLANSGDKLRNLNMDFDDFYEGHRAERLLNAMRFFPSQLLSLTLVVPSPFGSVERLLEYLHGCLRLIEGIQRNPGSKHLRDMRVSVEFNHKREPIAEIGCYLSDPGPSLDACKALEEALLVIPNSRILIHSPDTYLEREGRAEFWQPVFERAFPRLNKQGRLSLPSVTAPLSDRPQAGHEDRVTSLVVSHDSERIVTASEDGTIIIWDTSSGMVLQQWVAHRGDGVEDLALSPDSRRLVSAGGEAPVVQWAIDHDVQKVAELEGHTRAVLACDWSPDGELIASGSDDGTVRVWDGATYQQRDLALPAHSKHYRPGPYTYPLFELHFSPDSRHLAWIFGRDYCHVWEPLKGDQPITLQGKNWSRRYTYALSFDPEGRRIATTHGMEDRDNYDKDYPEECIVQIWDVATGAALTVLSGYLKLVDGDISFSPDGKTMLSGSRGDQEPVRVWDATSGEQLGWFKGSGYAVCYSPDGKYIASGMEGAVEVRRTDDLQGPCVATFTEHSYGVSHIAFSPNGKFLVSADWEGIVHIQPLFQVHDIGH